MSTFDGIVQEFPFITIDYFRKNPERPPPLACFLSHAHSDHLQGLESFRAPFIYCSAATRELLLRIEKYPHRMNFNNGVLESRRLHYKHLSKLLRPIPLNTPTEIDLTPRLSIRVTLLDANHCTGAVMFLIEGDGKAILYTGDIRAEPWWIDGIVRHPVMIPYTLGNKWLDKVYLDTTFAHTGHTFRTFPTKADGIAELLGKLEPYPENTLFYFRAWTFGYEEVWVALAAALKSKIHVDRYQIGLYKSVSASCREGSGATEAPSLCGFELGNRFIPGCLSEDERSRIHSCEPGVHCPVASSKNTVYVTPIVSRTADGSDVPEVGTGGGLGDLYQIHELELPDQSSLVKLEELCSEKIHDPQALFKAREALFKAFKSKSKTLSLDSYGLKDAHEMPLDELVSMLSRGRLGEEYTTPGDLKPSTKIPEGTGNPLPRSINFPYSRHSSYAELCELLGALKPRDVYPCTVDPLDWDEDISMQRLFGHLCSDSVFTHDQYMREITATKNDEPPRKRRRHDATSSTQSTQQSSATTDNNGISQASQSSLRAVVESRGTLAVVPCGHPPASEASTSRPPATSSPPPSPLSKGPPQPTPRTLEIIENSTSTPNNESLKIPSLSPETAKVRRDTIRQAWHLLHDDEKSQHEDFLLGPLPSSWPTDREISHQGLSMPETQLPEVALDKSSQATAVNEPSTENSQSTITFQRGEARSFHEENLFTDVDVVMDTDYSDTNTEHQTTPQPSSQHTVSSSAFASQSQNQQAQEVEHDFIRDEYYIREHEHPAPETSAGCSSAAQPRPFVRRESSIRNRMVAYAAAREDSYDAWAAMSLTSAGNNHTEEEVEL